MSEETAATTAHTQAVLTRLRITFGKAGNMRYVGNLDMHTVWERTFRWAELPLAYSKGFNPRPKFQVGSSLPLGASSQCELLDVWLENPSTLEKVRAALERALPPGLVLVHIEEVPLNLPALQTQISASDYYVTLRETLPGEELARRVNEFQSAQSLPREWRGKSYDLRPLVHEIRLENSGTEPRLFMRLSSREGATGRPEEVLSAIGLDPLSGAIERVALSY